MKQDLQNLVNEWKLEADDLLLKIKKADYSQYRLNLQNQRYQLRKCISQAEFILRETNQSSTQLHIKVCTGCGWRSDKKFESKTALACCPDSNYVELDEYLKNSIYKR